MQNATDQPSANQQARQTASNSLRQEESMPDLISPENLSKEYLKSLFDAAFMETSYDWEGDLRVKEGLSCWVFPSEDRIKLLATFGFKSHATRAQRLEFVNRVNRQYVIVRAAVRDQSDDLSVDHDFSIRGGVAPAMIVQSTKRFLSILLPAVQECDSDDIVK
jgi:Putative bacterial sensory transduction regulator